MLASDDERQRGSRQTSSSCHDTDGQHDHRDTTSSSTLLTNMSRPICTSSCSESMSDVMRRHDHAGLLAVVERHRQPLQVVEHPDAQVAEEALADAADQHAPGRGTTKYADDGDDDVAGDREVERAGVVLA